MNNIKDIKKHPILTIQCCTYNHASYIKQCLDGFVMQQTTFPFVAIVIDDASIDNEPQVLWDFINQELDSSVMEKEETEDYVRVIAPHKVNTKCTFDIFFLKYNHYSIQKSKASYLSKWNNQTKYIALCEGDDYWIDPYKLQKQFEALESHKECTIAYCRVQRITRDGRIIKNKMIPRNDHFKEGVVTLKDFCDEEFDKGHWCFHTSSFVIRKGYDDETEDRLELFKAFPYGDMPTQLWCLMHGNGYFVDDIGSCYRVLSGGYNSKIAMNPELEIKDERKCIEGLKYFDSQTLRKFSSQVKMHIRRKEFNICELQGKYFPLYKPKFWPFVMKKTLKSHLSLFVKSFFPSFHAYYRKRVK